MTKDKEVAVGVATRCGPRLVPEGTPIPETNAAASPVQAGTDPLVAELRERARTRSDFHLPMGNTIEFKAAERIAALEVERDTAWSDSEHDKESALSAERLGREYLDRAIAAESLLAEARDALEPFAEFAEMVAKAHEGWDHDGFTIWTTGDYPFPFRHFRFARATLSRLKPGEKGGGE